MSLTYLRIKKMKNKKSLSRRETLKILGGTTMATVLPFSWAEAAQSFTIAEKKRRNDIFFSYRSFWPEFEAMKQFRDAGVNTVCIFAANTDNSLGLPYSKYPPVWRWFGKYDFESLNRQYDDVLAINPDADFICMMDLNTPVWLQRQLSLKGHSAECESFTMLSCACANPEWRKEVAKYLETVITHMEERYGDRIKAYLLACGQTDEWMDYSQGIAGRTKTHAWKTWLKNKGKAEIPIPALERIDQASFENILRDPEVEQDVVDYAHFTGDLIVDTILGFVRTTRKLIPEQRQIGMFFGYILELTTSRMVWAGHLEYERLYSAPEIDFFISPGTYGDREMGGGSGFMIPNGTRVLNGKGFLHEIDHRTPTYNVDLDEYVSIDWMTPWKNQEETSAGLKREFSLAIINNASLWCFDMWGGVFQTAETMNLVQQSKQLWDRLATQKLSSVAEVALIVDPQSARHINDRNGRVYNIYQEIRIKLNRMGAPFEIYSFNDIFQIDTNRFKFFLFPGLFEVTSEKKQMLENYIFNNNRTALFVFAPGICNGKNIDTSRVKSLTGTEFKTPGVSKVQYNNWKSVYVPDYKTVTPQLLKQLVEEAGVTLYCQDETPVYANERLVCVHMANGGEKTITLKIDVSKVKELFTNREVPVVNRQFQYNFSSPDTALFELMV